MTRGSWPLFAGTFAAGLMLVACSGGGGSPAPSAQTAQTAQPTQSPQNQATPKPTPAATPAPTPLASPAIVTILLTVNGTPAVGSPGTYTITIAAESATGSVITGTYATPITLSNSDTSGATTLSVTSVPSSTTAVTLAYSGLGGSQLGGFDGATITASSGTASTQVAFLSGSACTTFPEIGGYYPCDLQSAYSLPSTIAGAGQTVAVIDAYDNPKAETDLGIYRAQFGLPPCTTANHCFEKVNQLGQQDNPPAADTIGWSLEETLDLDMVSAICPNCHILFVEVNDDLGNDLAAGVSEAAALGATQISNSYGGPEYATETTLDSNYNQPNAMVVASSGDSDYGVAYPASSPYVTAVGGTNLTVASDFRGWNEFVWNNANVQGAGSGCSAFEPKPAWQNDAGCPNRMVADVAALADPYAGVAIYDTYIVAGYTYGGWAVLGGTSVGAPIVAGIYALAGASPALLHDASYTYSHTSALNDVTNGSNGTCPLTTPYFCTAEVGYDGPTGNGTPNGVGAFGGPMLASTSSAAVRRSHVRKVRQALPGARLIRACPEPVTGHFSCDSLFVPQT
jgi:subtilase family serine protease